MEWMTLIIWTVVGLAVIAALMASGMVRYISNTEVGIVEKLWSLSGSLEHGFIALNGEAGFQADVLRGGFHFFVPFMYRVHSEPLITVRPGSIAYVFARDGLPLVNGQVLASNAMWENFLDVRGFLKNGGQQGPQRRILLPGTYAINVAQFVVITESGVSSLALSEDENEMIKELHSTLLNRNGFEPVVIKDKDDLIGIVTIHDGPALPSGEIVASEVGVDKNDVATYHNSFQDPEKFLAAGGMRGKQLQVLVDGTYMINRLFATVELVQKTVVSVGNAGVVVSYTGKQGKDISDASYRHGELVERGCRGVWKDPLLTGKYAFNTMAGQITMVPTSNIMLKWQAGSSGGTHRLDDNLSEISMITKDAFSIVMPLSIVIHIDYAKAPELIQRFGDVKRLIEGTLDPIVSGYFKNIGQQKTIIELLQQRTEIQKAALEEMRIRFSEYTLVLEDVVIGTPRAADEKNNDIDRILEQLKSRQIATEQKETFRLQKEAAEQERTLNEARAVAAQQAKLTESNIQIEISKNSGAADVARAKMDAEKIATLADAEKTRLTMEGQGEAERILSIGKSEAEAGKLKVAAYGGPDIRLAEILGSQFFQAVSSGQIALVPQVQVGGEGQNGGTIEALMGLFLKDQLEKLKKTPTE